MKYLLTAVLAFGLAIQSAAAQAPVGGVTEHLTFSQWVTPEVPGELSGQVILPVSNGSVAFIADAIVMVTDRDGKVLQGSTDESGRFLVRGVTPGVYALTAHANGVFACCAMHVLDSCMPGADLFPKQVEVAAAPIDYNIVKAPIFRYLPPSQSRGLYTIADVDLPSIARLVVGEDLYRVGQVDGGFNGRFYVAGAKGKSLESTGVLNVLLLRDGKIVDQVLSDENGTFRFGETPVGEYSILAIGQSGLAMVGFELVDIAALNRVSMLPNGGNRNDGNTQHLVAAYKNLECCSELSLQLAPLPEAVTSLERIEEEQPTITLDEYGNPIGGDGFGDPALGGDGALTSSGAGGGGGSGGGGGGFGGLGGLAGLAAIAAIAGNNDNDPLPGPAPPASPTR